MSTQFANRVSALRKTSCLQAAKWWLPTRLPLLFAFLTAMSVFHILNPLFCFLFLLTHEKCQQLSTFQCIFCMAPQGRRKQFVGGLEEGANRCSKSMSTALSRQQNKVPPVVAGTKKVEWSTNHPTQQWQGIHARDIMLPNENKTRSLVCHISWLLGEVPSEQMMFIWLHCGLAVCSLSNGSNVRTNKRDHFLQHLFQKQQP